MSDAKKRPEASINELLETFNADSREIAAFMENPKSYLEKLGATGLENISDEELRAMIQNHAQDDHLGMQ